MIQCTLGEKTYRVDMVTGRAMREMGKAMKVVSELSRAAERAAQGEAPDTELRIEEALDTLVDWFCLLFGRQFTMDEVYDGYPSDRLVHDVTLALLSVQAQATEALSDFPTKPETNQKS